MGRLFFGLIEKMKKLLPIILGILVLNACKKDDPETNLPEVYEGEELSGGQHNTVYDQSENAFGLQSPALSGIDELEFFVGNSFFNQNWVSSPASTTARDGLGPTFNAKSCSSCHFKDGRGAPQAFDGENTNGFLVRLSVAGEDQHGGPVGDPHYGKQLNDRSVLDVPHEGRVSISYTEITGQFDDGETYTLLKPNYSFYDLGYGPLASDVMISPRIGNQMIGLGLLEAIDEADILALADEFDTDGDGISGRPNMVWNVKEQKPQMGRFGWKANEPTLEQQTAGAFLGDIGITSSLFPNQNCPDGQTDCQNAANGGNPEIEDDDLHKTVLYVSSLAVPARRNVDDETVLRGREIFMKIDCGNCHNPSFTTGKHPVFDHLSNEKIWPYTDMLLHDLGPELADGRPDYAASGTEWRTQPLWGIGLIETVNGHTNFLHDGRARNLQEAILWHGGEAENAKNNFKALSKEDREAVITFLESL